MNPAEPQVVVANQQSFWMVDEQLWSDLAAYVLRREAAPTPSEMSLAFVDTAAITDLNRQYKGNDAPTDVLAFPAAEGPAAEGSAAEGPAGEELAGDSAGTLLGDVVVCPEIAQRNVLDCNHYSPAHFDHPALDETTAEVALLVAHGTLHLCGYDHVEPEERELMFARQQSHLSSYFATYPPGQPEPSQPEPSQPSVTQPRSRPKP